jgi:hypothetical protein
MTREKALETMDKLVAMGYHVELSEYDLGPSGHVMVGDDGEMTSLRRWLSIKQLSVDKIDLRALVAAADELELDIGFSPLQGGQLSFTDMPSEDERRRQAVTGGKRSHPR